MRLRWWTCEADPAGARTPTFNSLMGHQLAQPDETPLAWPAG